MGGKGGGGSTAIHQEYKRGGFNVQTKKTKLNIQLVNYIEYSRPKLEMKHIDNPERYPHSFLFLFVLCNEVSPSICGICFVRRVGFMAHNKVDDERIENTDYVFF